ncbi:Uu.00g098460.m01.CDS01 [Anthostomella pinea]|uniref:Beta-glucosidase cel3A n=1 Tax=Anthostomella pinea TaxID=933095 RepID=A0AAI8VDA2_9PEZI|nr:Uu.00g098460.m01.CDS01 [Anthostomella pinea]
MNSLLSLASSALFLQGASALGYGFNGSDSQFYGQSPPVYPSSIGHGTSNARWVSAYQRATALADQMTIEQKVNMTRGYTGTCTGNSGAVPRFGVPPLCLSDAPDGIRGQEFVSAFPAGIHVAATWDRTLMYQYGKALGSEYRGKGINVALGPVAGPLGRVVRGGRNWEGLSNDPYLAGAGMGEITRGIQDAGVMATSKHFLLNEQEYRRRPSSIGEAFSSNVGDRALHELYVFPFMDALRADAAAVMCSYQRANNSYSCQNSKLLNGLLKTELGFEGFVRMLDWTLVMPDGGYWGQNLTDAVKNGSVSAERVTDMATRILASWYYMGHDNGFPAPSIYPGTTKHEPVDVQADHAALIREIGAASTVLVKNVNNTLPLQRPTFLCVYGYDATVPSMPWQDASRYGGGYAVNFGWQTFAGTLITGGGSGSNAPPYVVSPFQAIQERLRQDRGINPTYTPYVNADACLVFINAYASESFDRLSLTDESSDRLVGNVAANCSNTVVVIHSTGIRNVDAWIDNPNITAVLYAGLPGQESGNSLADVLWGDVSPSGKLPYTVAKEEADYGAVLSSSLSFDQFPQDDFTEGLFIDCRAFDRDEIEPRFEFGFGLTYTTFEYAKLNVQMDMGANTDPLPDPEVAVISGGHPALWETVATVTCALSNTGRVTASEVAQLYLGIPSSAEFDTPARQLRGFQRTPVRPGETRTVSFALTRRDLSVWDTTVAQWRLQAGTYKIHVGASSQDLRLEGNLEISSS